MCPDCQKRVQTCKYGKAGLYLDYVTEVAQYINENYPTLKIIIWDDMLRNIDLNILQSKEKCFFLIKIMSKSAVQTDSE